jgi:cytochrome c
MLSRRSVTAALAFGLVVAWVGSARAEQDRATPQEVIQRVQQAAQELAKSGEAGLATFSGKNATSVWKDSYTFVQDCKSGSAVSAANPVRPGNKGKPVAQTAIYGPKSGEQLAAEFCAAARQPHGGWLEYNFPKPGETQAVRKVSYMLAVQGTPYVVGAGLYDENAKVEDLDKLTGGQ